MRRLSRPPRRRARVPFSRYLSARLDWVIVRLESAPLHRRPFWRAIKRALERQIGL